MLKPARFALLSLVLVGVGSTLGSCASGNDEIFGVEPDGVGGTGGLTTGDASTGGPASCGNGIVDTAQGELCDGSNLNGETCSSVTMGASPSGVLACNAGCTFDMSGCSGVSAGGAGGTTSAGGAGGTSGSGTGAAGGSGGTSGGGGMGVGGTSGGTCNPAFCPSTFGTPCCLTPNGPCGCDMGMGCMSCNGGGG